MIKRRKNKTYAPDRRPLRAWIPLHPPPCLRDAIIPRPWQTWSPARLLSEARKLEAKAQRYRLKARSKMFRDNPRRLK